MDTVNAASLQIKQMWQDRKVDAKNTQPRWWGTRSTNLDEKLAEISRESLLSEVVVEGEIDVQDATDESGHNLYFLVWTES